MNPLATRSGTFIVGIALAVVIILAFSSKSHVNPLELWVWSHVIVGITWIGLLYYFNLIQIPAVNRAIIDKNPGPDAINKYIAPRALFWFRWAALLTWLTGAMALEALYPSAVGSGIISAFTFQKGYELIGVGAWLGTIMLFNVWVLIWPNQKKLLGFIESTDEEKARAKKIAFTASRINTALSIPMLLSMTGHMHGLPFSF